MMKALTGSDVLKETQEEQVTAQPGLAEELMMKALLLPEKPPESVVQPPPQAAEQLLMKALLTEPDQPSAQQHVQPSMQAIPDAQTAQLPLATPAAPSQVSLQVPAETLLWKSLQAPANPNLAAAPWPTSRVPTSDWPTASAEGVCKVLDRFPQLDVVSKDTLRNLPPLHALAILWDMDAKGGCGAQSPLEFIACAARTLAHARILGAPTQPLQAPLPAPPAPIVAAPVQMPPRLVRMPPQSLPLHTAHVPQPTWPPHDGSLAPSPCWMVPTAAHVVPPPIALQPCMQGLSWG